LMRAHTRHSMQISSIIINARCQLRRNWTGFPSLSWYMCCFIALYLVADPID
jgi:hypothetical protein